MTVHQISIFVENKSGTLLRVLDLFKEAGVQLIASTISDTVEYTVLSVPNPRGHAKCCGRQAFRPACRKCLPSRWTTVPGVRPMPYV